MGKVIIVVVIGTAIVLSLITLQLEIGVLRAWAVIVTLSIIPVFVAGFVIGNVESRGKMAGIDLAFDKLGNTYDHATRTIATLERKRPQPTSPPIQILNATSDGLPSISHRRLTDDETVDL